MATFCVFCGASPAQSHHITGRPAKGAPYFDAVLVLALCQRCHTVEHAGWRSLGLDLPGRPARARLARAAYLAARLGDQDEPVALPPSWWAALADCLRALLAEEMAA